jgi:hypothetical protein
MRVIARVWLVGAAACLFAAFSASAAFGAFAIAKWEAGTCTEADCTASTPEKFYTQAAGHPPFGITEFVLTPPMASPKEAVKRVRVDLPPGLSVNPQATQQCEQKDFESVELKIPGLPPGIYAPSTCPSGSVVGKDFFTVVISPTEVVHLEGTVYNLKQPEGLPLEFGIAIDIAPLTGGLLPPTTGFSHIFLQGHVSWHHEEIPGGVVSGNYHEFFEIGIPETPPTIMSRLVTSGNIGNTTPLNGALITMPSSCEGPQVTSIFAETYGGEKATSSFTTPVGVEGCDKVPFAPAIGVTPSTTQSDRPDAATVKVALPQNPSPEGLYSSDLKDARVTLPEGMTLNPAAVNGLEACTDAQFGRGSAGDVGCPAASQIGTVTIETPNLPPGSLHGGVYAGTPLSTNPESGQEYRIFINAQSKRYDVAVRLEGRVIANASSGRLTTMVLENPQLPFSDFSVSLSGPHVPLANPLVCGAATTTGNFAPYTGHPPAVEAFMAFPIDFDGKGGACPSPLPFALSQSTQANPTTGGSTTSFTLSLARGDGNQYLGKVSATLPEGLVAKIPTVPLCGEPQAQRGECPAASQIGTVTVAVGSGASPYTLSGNVYLTGPYGIAPYGLSVVVAAEKVGPYNYGKIVTRAGIAIDVFTARVTVSSLLPTVVGGAPLRLRTLTVNVNRPNFMLNPTNCGVLFTETSLYSTFGALDPVSTPFQASGCSALQFKPRFSARTDAKASRKNGAMLEVNVGYPAGAQANIKSVVVQLPKQLPSRLSTLNHACPEATFLANPHACPEGSRVGGATATTPTLPEKLTGRAFFVSHGGAAFPDLDIDLNGNGVTIVLIGNTNIFKGITTSTFAAIPDVPVSGFTLKLPYGRFSALAAHGNLCRTRLVMPTTITAQNGAVIKQNTRISVSGCGVQILSHRVRGHRVSLSVQAPSAGRLTVGGGQLATVHRRVRKAGRVSISVGLSPAGLRALSRHHPLTVRLQVRFVPTKGRASRASAKVRFG